MGRVGCYNYYNLNYYMHNLFTCPLLFMFKYYLLCLLICVHICIIRLNNSFDIYRDTYTYIRLTTASALQYVHLVDKHSWVLNRYLSGR